MADPDTNAPTPPTNGGDEAPASPFVQAAEAANPFAVANDTSQALNDAPTTISWTASEFIAHDKDTRWYVWLGAWAVVVATVIYLITRDVISTAVVIVAALLLGFYGSRKPREIQYGVNAHVLSIGNRQYNLEDFRSFAILPEGAFSSIEFMPLKRFSPPISIYYAPDDEAAIVSLLSDQLPFEHRELGAVDRLMRRIRF
jgi:hypothetical protein